MAIKRWLRRIFWIIMVMFLWAAFVEYEASQVRFMQKAVARVVSHTLYPSHSSAGRGYNSVTYHPFARTTVEFELEASPRQCTASYPGSHLPLKQPLQLPAARWVRLHPEGSTLPLVVHRHWTHLCQVVYETPAQAQKKLSSDVRAFLYAPSFLIVLAVFVPIWVVTMCRGLQGKPRETDDDDRQ